ncbi:hypothetical protein FGG08_000771 [Glutinoglossum americanum]|uniref:M protein repeat protein n=1 Tax=Glutinoglossum americanum TaxID=1670608 RepID=A0A9P8L5W2_9PEZI|nr:hypothetical protein FGG08_000771 [Glutinoglossum americanum]
MEDREKAEKLAAAKKRVQQLKKQKEKKDSAKKKGEEGDGIKPDAEASAIGESANAVESKGERALTAEEPGVAAEPREELQETSVTTNSQPPSTPLHGRQPSLSVQSKIRSSSFRRSPTSANEPPGGGAKSPTLLLLSPEGDTIADIYRKQASRLEELERENRRLAKEAKGWEEKGVKWMQKEEELEELVTVKGEVGEWKEKAKNAATEIEKLYFDQKYDMAALQRQNSHLQSQTGRARHSASLSQAHISASPASDLESALQSKEATIESMEMEISRLRAELSIHNASSEGQVEQVAALEAKLERAETAAGSAQRQLQDLKKNLERASERAVKEGSQRTSAETKINELEKEIELANGVDKELRKKVESLEKKIITLTTLHKESDTRSQENARQRTRLEKEAQETRARVATLENENLRLREAAERRKKAEASGVDDDGVDELEDEGRRKLEARIRILEGELFEAQRKGWRDQKQTLLQQHNATSDDAFGARPRTPDRQFSEVDLSGGSPISGSPFAGRVQSSFTNVLSEGFNALTGSIVPPVRQGLELDDDDGFDEEAFRIAQEEEARKRVEKIKEVKRGLKDWEGWRMDLVEQRAGGVGIGDIFEI